MQIKKPNFKLVLIIFLIFLTLTLFLSSIQYLRNKQDPINPYYLTGNYLTGQTTGIFHNKEFKIPEEIETKNQDLTVLGSKSGEKRIEIDLSEQKLKAYQGKNRVYEFLVSTGKWGQTPTGEFRIWNKIKYTLMAGGSKELGTYYYLPNVPFTMFFYNEDIPKMRGYGIHGTYWHSNFGHPMSHGCINMKTEEAEKLFYWANPVLAEGQVSVNATEDNQGTRVLIYD